MRLRYSIALIAAALLVTGPLAARADTGAVMTSGTIARSPTSG